MTKCLTKCLSNLDAACSKSSFAATSAVPERGPARDITLLNAAAALLAAGAVNDFEEGIRVAASTIDFGDAMKTFGRLREVSKGT